MVEISHATADNADEIARLHAASWKLAYRGIVDESYLNGELETQQIAYWEKAMREGHYAAVLVAREQGRIVGFSGLGRDPRDAAFAQTVENLHVLPDMKGNGLGRALMGASAQFVRDAGGENICLWVYQANEPAIAFYKALGAARDEEGFDLDSGKPDVRMVWRDLDALIARCEVRT